MFKRIVSDTYQYMEAFNWVQMNEWCWIVLLMLIAIFVTLFDVTLLLLHSNTWNHLTVCKQMINSK